MSRKYEVQTLHWDCQKFLSCRTLWDLSGLLGMNPALLLLIANTRQYRTFVIPKPKGGKRLLEVPEPLLKEMQKRLNGYLQSVYYRHKPACSYGFVRNPFLEKDPRTILSHAKNHINKNDLYRIDLKDFFHQVSEEKVVAMFQAEPFAFHPAIAALLARLTTFRGRLPMGAPTSPVISNLVFMSADHIISKIAAEKKMTYTRYADDLYFSGKEVTEGFTSIIKELLVREGYVINNKKTRRFSRSFRQTVTGIKVNVKPNVDRREIRNLRAVFHQADKYGIDATALFYNIKLRNRPTVDTQFFINSLWGRIDFIGKVRGERDLVYKSLLVKYHGLTRRMSWQDSSSPDNS